MSKEATLSKGISTDKAKSIASKSQGESKKSIPWSKHTFESFLCQLLSISKDSIKS